MRVPHVNPWVPMAATIAYNLHCHRRGTPTICSTTRRALPSKGQAVAVLTAGFAGLLIHYIEGYPLPINLDLSEWSHDG